MGYLLGLDTSRKDRDQEVEWAWATAAHSPRTMGKAAKGPAGMAGFLKEKSQNELLGGGLLMDPCSAHPNLLYQTETHGEGGGGG